MSQDQNGVGPQRRFVERRKRKDWVARSVTVISIVGWVAAIAVMQFLDKARPAQESFLTRFFNVPVVSGWNSTLLRYALILLAAVFLVCVVGFFVNMARHRRKTDRYNKAIIILGGLSLAGIIAFLIAFRQHL